MTKDKSNTPKGGYNLRSKKNYKKAESSDSSSSESEYESEENQVMDKKEYKKN